MSYFRETAEEKEEEWTGIPLRHGRPSIHVQTRYGDIKATVKMTNDRFKLKSCYTLTIFFASNCQRKIWQLEAKNIVKVSSLFATCRFSLKFQAAMYLTTA